MNKDLTHIVMVIDRSQSMNKIRKEAEDGINKFVETQKEQPGRAVFTLVQFNTDYDFVYKNTPLEKVLAYALVPCGWTALRDAVGRAVDETGDYLSRMNEADRPGLVVFVIVTDGEENSSKEYSQERIKQMVELQQNVYKWQFTYLGANVDAFQRGGELGVKTSGLANFDATPVGAQAAYAAAAGNVRRMRAASARGLQVENKYTTTELDAMSDRNNPSSDPTPGDAP